jgi:phosphoesterase family protein
VNDVLNSDTAGGALILASPAWAAGHSLLIITFDENGFTDIAGCCAPPALGGRIGLVALDSAGHIAPGTITHTTYDHWSYLRTVEDMLGIDEHLNVSGFPTTRAMADLFQGTP